MILGVESGATGATAVLADPHGRVIARVQGPGWLPAADFERVFSALLRTLQKKSGVPLKNIRRMAVCMAGLSLQSARGDIKKRLSSACRMLEIRVKPQIHSDIISTLAGAFGGMPGLVIVSGTGSCAMAQDGRGHARRAGGWGQRLGDEGSGYAIGLEALRAVLARQDGLTPPSSLSRAIERKLGFKSLAQVIAWGHRADKAAIAALASMVFSCAKRRDVRAMDILETAREKLLALVRPLCQWIKESGVQTIPIVFTGGIFENEPAFVDSLTNAIARAVGAVQVRVTKGSKGEGALQLALGTVKAPTLVQKSVGGFAREREETLTTENLHPRCAGIETFSSEEIVRVIQEEDRKIPGVLQSQQKALAKAVDWIAAVVGCNGRVFYAGAGTSGRLAALDAAEIPPTFGLPPDVFNVILAGGTQALTQSIEGAEDDEEDAIEQLRSHRLSAADMVVGIAASGTTPFVLAAMHEAKRIGAKTMGIVCNPNTPLEQAVDLCITACVGPEVVSGSTRMKAGTATKLILNTLSTAAMIRLGKVYDGWMVDVQPTNAKLRLRAARIVTAISGCSEDRARELLEESGWNTKAAIVAGKIKIPVSEAKERLRACDENLRSVLEMEKR